MSARFVGAEGAARPIGHYSAAAVVPEARLVFAAGQVALDASGQVVGPGDMAAQTRQAYENLRAVLESVGARLDTVVKTTTFVTDIKSYHATASAVRRELFPKDPPPGTLVEISALSRPELLVEVEAVALIAEASAR